MRAVRGMRRTGVGSGSGSDMAETVMEIMIFVMILLLGVPLAVGLLLAGDAENATPQPEVKEDGLDAPAAVSVWIEEKGKTEEIDFEDYVTAVTASEMPASFDTEALKAQSVAARTYAMAKILKYDEKQPSAHPDAPLCDSTHCQVYKSEKDLIALHDKGWENDGWKKIKEACKATEGEMLYYGGELVMQPLFFSSSGGQTENSEDVFTGAYPYLVSVSSPYEENASHKDEKKTFSASQVRTALESAFPDRPVGDLSAGGAKILSRTAGGRVDDIQVGDSRFRGTEVRNALGLSSALFTVDFDTATGEMTFTSSGYGHGVGLSQYGADGMAKEGFTYKEILTHYYTGTEVY